MATCSRVPARHVGGNMQKMAKLFNNFAISPNLSDSGFTAFLLIANH
jgi:hypothetical protein